MTRPMDAPKALSLAAALCVIYAFLFALTDIQLWHPGAAWPDELLTNVRWTQEWREGLALPMSFFKGCLHRSALAWSGGIGTPSLARLHLPAFLAFFIECAALMTLGKRYFSESAGLFAVAINAVAAFTLLRLRSLLSYSVIPAELLTMLVILPWCKSPFKSLIWGLAAGLLLLEYEAWALALPALALAWMSAERGQRPRLAGALPGFCAGAGAVVALSWPEFSDYMSVRASQSFAGVDRSLAGNLKGYFFGAEALPYTGLSRWPVFPMLAWPGLFLGGFLALREKRWTLLWIAVGFTPLISGNSAAEPQRMIVAWPALCLLAGAGFDFALKRWRVSFGLTAALLIFGSAIEAWAYTRSMNAHYASTYGYSVNLAAAAGQLHNGMEAITELDSESMAATRFFLESAGVRPGCRDGGAFAILPWEYAAGLEKEGELRAIVSVPGSTPAMLFFPGPIARFRLEAVESTLGPLWRGTPRFIHRQARQIALKHLLENPRADPWVKSACFENALGQSFMVGEFPADLVRMMEKQKLQSVSGLLWAAERLRATDPAWAARLQKRALQLDPRRRDAFVHEAAR